MIHDIMKKFGNFLPSGSLGGFGFEGNGGKVGIGGFGSLPPGLSGSSGSSPP